MSATPRTDEVYFAAYEEAGQAQEAMYEHACKLELELAAIGAAVTCQLEGCYALRPVECAPATTCQHGKGLTDYCQPCGRINSGNL